MKALKGLALLLLFAILPLAWAGAQSPKPEDTVRAFVEAINRKDAKAAHALVLTEEPLDADNLFSDLPMRFTITNLRVELIEPYLATVSFTLSATISPADLASKQSAPSPAEDHLRVLLVKNEWRILPSSTDAFGRGPEMRLSSIAMMLNMSKMFTSSKEAAKGTASLSNAKQIAVAVLMYAGDHDDVYPTAKDPIAAIMPYLKNRDLLTAPGAPAGTVSYSFNEKLFGISETSVVSPADTVMLYEGKNHLLNFAHNGKAAVAFVDGHAKLVSPQQAQSLNWDPKK